MIKALDIEMDFTNRLGWLKLNGLPGNFSVTPDRGKDFVRVFSSDIKVNKLGRSLMGLIGFHCLNSDYKFRDRLGLSAYITNFNNFSSVPILQSPSDLSCWVDKISLAVLSLPSGRVELMRDIDSNRIGPFELRVFAGSTPWYDDFVRWAASGDQS